VHQPLLAPTDDILKVFKRDKGDWNIYENSFIRLMQQRKIEDRFKSEMFDDGCLLYSEGKPHHCHILLVCEYLKNKWDGTLKVHHL